MVSGPFPFYGPFAALPEAGRAPRGARRHRPGRGRQARRARPRRAPTCASSIPRPSSRPISTTPGWSCPPRPREVNRHVAAAAEARRIFVNAVDDPPNASAYLGGVIRRSGVTIAISTSGEAPALAGVLREGIDALLPADLDRWTACARDLRTDLESGRRADGRPPATLDRRAEGAVSMKSSPGFISLVGAGPGRSGTPDPRRARPPAAGGPRALRRARQPRHGRAGAAGPPLLRRQARRAAEHAAGDDPRADDSRRAPRTARRPSQGRATRSCSAAAARKRSRSARRACPSK